MSPASRLRRCIVIIDDDPVLAGLVRDLLIDEHFDVTLCGGWQDAHACVTQARPDLVLLDLRFGNSDSGWRVLDELRGDPTTRRLPIILWSAAIESVETRAAELRSEDGIFVLPKPLDLDTLLGTIEEAMAAPVLGVGRYT